MVNTAQTYSTLLPDWLARSATNTPDHLAIRCGSVSWTFAQLDEQATSLARQLAGTGVVAGNRVALLAANGLPYVAVVHALTRLGAILVPLNTRLTLQELCWQVQDVRATHLLSDGLYAGQADSVAEQSSSLVRGTLGLTEQGGVVLEQVQEQEASNFELSREIDLATVQAIMYTSGTTGNPKGVLLTYGMQWWNAIGSSLNLEHRADDCWLACLQLFHIGGLAILFRSVINGTSVILHEKFDAAAINASIVENKVTIISVVAVMLQRMLTALDAGKAGAGYPLSLRCVLLGGGPAPRPLLEECARRNIPVVQTYGLTEACSQAVTLSPADALRKLGSAGKPLMPVQVRIMQEDRLAMAGESGVICLKGPSITQGYADRPSETARAIKDGWLSTGDIGYLDEDGYLYVLDRRSDLIISGGENVYPAEIEAVLLAHPAVAEAGVCGMTDAHWGQVPLGFVVLYDGQTVSSEGLLEHARLHLARYKLPKMIYQVKQLPRTSSGKLLRRALPDLLEQPGI